VKRSLYYSPELLNLAMSGCSFRQLVCHGMILVLSFLYLQVPKNIDVRDSPRINRVKVTDLGGFVELPKLFTRSATRSGRLPRSFYDKSGEMTLKSSATAAFGPSTRKINQKILTFCNLLVAAILSKFS
jgi:hypothetical protein